MKCAQEIINLLPFRPLPVLVAVCRVSCQIRYRRANECSQRSGGGEVGER